VQLGDGEAVGRPTVAAIGSGEEAHVQAARDLTHRVEGPGVREAGQLAGDWIADKVREVGALVSGEELGWCLEAQVEVGEEEKAVAARGTDGALD
jgi:hypothetical protein